jgi:hypothetical protein
MASTNSGGGIGTSINSQITEITTALLGEPKAQVCMPAGKLFIQRKETDMKNINSQDFVDLKARTNEEISRALDKLADQVWYNRHLNLESEIEQCIKTVDPKIWKQALRAAEKVRANYPDSELGPFTDFEWGMLNGKLSALRWILGEDWDVLDT